jgi:hypothetical protein
MSSVIRDEENLMSMLDAAHTAAARNHSNSNSAPHTRHFDRVSYYGSIQQQAAAKQQLWRESYTVCFLTCYLYFSSCIFAIAGVVTVVSGIQICQSHQQRLLGEDGDTFAVWIIGSGGGMIAFSFLGLLVARTRYRVLLWSFIALLILLVIAFVGLFLFELCVISDAFVQGWGSRIWMHQIQNSARELCLLQRDFKCSGFTSDCANHSATTPPTDCPNCNNTEYMYYNQACWPELRSTLTDNLRIISYIIMIGGSITVITLAASCFHGRKIWVTPTEIALYESITASST